MASESAAALPSGLPQEPLVSRRGAVVVGGGPAGTAAALALAKVRGWTDVTLIEKAPSLDWADPDRGYTYSIDGRGLKALTVLGVAEGLREAAVEVKRREVTFIDASGKAVTSGTPMRDKSRVTYLLPRPVLVGVLAECIEAHNKGAGTPDAKIRVLTGSRVVRMDRVPAPDGRGQRVALVVRTAGQAGEAQEDKEEVLFPALVVGCDGINSLVRRTLEEWAKEDAKLSAQPIVPRRPAPTFSLRKYDSAAVGLRFKVLHFVPNPVTRAGHEMRNATYAALRGSYKGQSLTMVLFPIRNPNAGRTGVMTARPDHPFWTIPRGDAAAWRTALAEIFPQVDFDTQVPDGALQAYADAPGGAFPMSQASDGVAYVVDDPADSAKGTGQGAEGPSPGVIILGDAAHAFPPDCAQGVNGALQDVDALVRLLQEHDDDVPSTALAYQAERSVEADALAQLAATVFPYQYMQAVWPARLFKVQFTAQLTLSQLLGKSVIAPPAFFMIQDINLKYSEILRRANVARYRIIGGVLVAAGAALALALRRRSA